MVTHKMCLLTGILGDKKTSPLHAIVKHCEPSVFESKILKYVVEFKWNENVFPILKRGMIFTAVRIIAVVFGMIGSSRYGRHWLCDLLVILMLPQETQAVYGEVQEVVKEGAKYFKSLWNMLELTGSTCLFVAALGHFLDEPGLVHRFGAIGMAFKIFGLLETVRVSHLAQSQPVGPNCPCLEFMHSLQVRTFKKMGPLIRMIAVITSDIVNFIFILLIIGSGITMFFMASLIDVAASFLSRVALILYSPHHR